MKAVVYLPFDPEREPKAVDFLEIRSDLPIPKPGPGQILVKVEAVAQNGAPDGYNVANPRREAGTPIGHDFAGTIQEIGPKVPPETGRYVGERVAGFINGGLQKEKGGTYAEYVVAEAEVVLSIGPDISFANAASLGLVTYTAVQGLYTSLSPPIPRPSEPTKEPLDILIWGGASAVGLQAIQLAKLSGFRVITTASPKNHDLIKRYGADEAFDYRDPDVVQKIHTATSSKLKYAFDTISTQASTNLTEMSIGNDGGSVALVLPSAKFSRRDVVSKFGLVFTMLGKPLTVPYTYPVIPEDYKLAVEYSKLLSKLLQDGKLKAPPVFIPPGGFKEVGKWQDWGSAGGASGQKLVFLIKDGFNF